MSVVDFGQFRLRGQFDFGQLAEVELAEVEIGQSRAFSRAVWVGACPGEGERGGANPEKWGTQSLGAQNVALFFHSPASFFFLSSLSWGSSRGILVCS